MPPLRFTVSMSAIAPLTPQHPEARSPPNPTAPRIAIAPLIPQHPEARSPP
ncbi:MAG: hypothetical protein VKJ64_22205 [Leptolyngbyaceae bacterium]|nr:hypothetical protein [Leptolyngbyaceae bacterium]